MKLCELTSDMIDLLKQNLIAEDKDVSYGELAAANDTVSDEELEERYGDTEFVPEDFTSEPRTVTTCVNKQTGLTLTVYGDPGEDESVDLVLSKDGKKLGEWSQDFTKTKTAPKKFEVTFGMLVHYTIPVLARDREEAIATAREIDLTDAKPCCGMEELSADAVERDQ